MMLVIIAHHYIVNSPIYSLVNQISLNKNVLISPIYDVLLNSIFAILFGSGGKMAINVFILISGYFMCKQEFRWKKVIYLCLQVEFYKIIIYIIFLITGYNSFSKMELYSVILCIPYGISKGFTGSFIAFYCLIPFLNKFISSIDKKIFQKFLLTFFLTFCIIPTLVLDTKFEYISWYIFVYLIGSYIRLYPIEYFENNKKVILLTCVSLIISWISIIGIFLVQYCLKKQLPISWFWFVSDSNKPLALLPAIMIFYSFKNLKIGTNKVINLLGGSTFGVLLIHASSNTMRKWLWQDICKNKFYFETNLFIVHAIACVIMVYGICVLIDIIRKTICKVILIKFEARK